MATPLRVTFRGFKHTPERDQFIREQVAALQPVASHRMTSCHVVSETTANPTSPAVPSAALAQANPNYRLLCGV